MFTIVEADLSCPDHASAIVDVTDAYAREPHVGGRPLPVAVRESLIAGLRAHPTTLVMLAFDGERPVGVATCFRGFSTFAARPLMNIHDLAVVATHRGRGIGRQLIVAVEQRARELGCCKLTLEVQERNWQAKGLYESLGFASQQYDEETGGQLFFSKPL